MGEYGVFKNDTILPEQEIKFGTCEDMMYIRFTERDKVFPDKNSIDPKYETELFYRLPFPDEDNKSPNDREPFREGIILPEDYFEEHPDKENIERNMLEDPGITQSKTKGGVLINTPCYHGLKLPDPPPKGQTFWNSKIKHMHLAKVKHKEDDQVYPIIQCRVCGHMYRMDISYTIEYLKNKQPKSELAQRVVELLQDDLF